MKVQTPSDAGDGSILSAQIEQCYRQLPISLVVNLVNGLFLIVVLWEAANTSLLLVWSLLLIAVTSVRFLALRAFMDATRGAQFSYETWRHYFVIGACAAGVVWGAAGGWWPALYPCCPLWTTHTRVSRSR